MKGKAWRRVIRLAVVLVILAGAVYGLRQFRQTRAEAALPLATAKKGEFLVLVRCRGELVARRSEQLAAPLDATDLQIVWLAPAGGPVKKDEVVIRFDPSRMQQDLKEKQAALDQAQASLDQALADAKIAADQDTLDLSTARYAMEKAKLEASKQAIMSKIQGEESDIDFGLTEEKLKVQQASNVTHQKTNESKIASLQQARDTAKAQVDFTQHQLSLMELKSPLDGVINYMNNYSSGWANAQPFKVGDHAVSGGILAEIPDLSTLQMESKVDETDRGRVAVGDKVLVHVDAFPEKVMPASLVNITPLTEVSFTEWPPTRSFRAYAQIESPDSRLRPGMNAGADIVQMKIPDAVSIPAKALFTQAGQPIVYLKKADRYVAQRVQVRAKNPDEVAIGGIAGGDMVALAEPPGTTLLFTTTVIPTTTGAEEMSWRSRAVVVVIGCAATAGATWYGLRAYRGITQTKQVVIPTVKVQRGDLTLTVTAKGELRGGNPEVLTAPMIGGTDLHLTTLKRSGEPVKDGEVVVEFDTTEQEYKLKEAEADLAEAEQHLIQANAEARAQEEEDAYALSKAQADLRTAELDVKKNPLLPEISAKENTLALEGAEDHLKQLEHNVANRKATTDAALAIQEAGKGKAESQAKTAKDNIEAMTLKAHRNGYFSVKQNQPNICCFFGMTLPEFQSGDTVRPGMAVAEIPDLKNWELAANVSELDRGHLALGQKVDITIIAVAGHAYRGTVKDLGATGGPPWDRHFECKIALDNPSAELRPGMSAQIVVTTDELHGVLSLPAQALFESDGRTFVYSKGTAGFMPKDVKLVRRSEMRVVIEGVGEGQEVALSNPTDVEKKKAAAGGALQSLGK